MNVSSLGLTLSGLFANIVIPSFSSVNSPVFDVSKATSRKIPKMPLSAKSKELSRTIAKKINANSEDIEAVIYAESGGNPQAINSSGGASGLIQFTRSTAISLGTTVEALRKMTAEEQMVYVEKYLIKAKGMAKFKEGEKLSGADVYALVFCPARARQEKFYHKGTQEYELNKSCDLNGDGVITKTEMAIRAGFKANG